MAKLNKSDAIEVACNIAEKNPQVLAVTLELLKTLSYSERHALARTILLETTVGQIDTRDNYMADVCEAFVDRAVALWSRLEKQYRIKQDSWKRAISGITSKQATAKIVNLIESMNIRGARVDSNRLEITRGRCSSTLYFRLDHDYEARVVNPDNADQKAGEYNFSVEYSVSGTTYTPAEMAVVTKINAELLDAGNELTAMMSRERIVWTWGMPEEVTEA